MEAASQITCLVCHGNNFHKRDGLRICATCQTESQEHGVDTSMDDMADTFIRASSTIKSVRLGRPHKAPSFVSKGARACKTSFTTCDLATFILKGWTTEVMALGAPDSLTDVVLAIWSLWIQRTGHGFNSNITPKRLSCRDFQVKLFGRKRIIGEIEIFCLKRKRTQAVVPSSDSDLADSDKGDDREMRRKRAKKRRAFLKKLVESSASSESGNDSEGSNVSWMSNYDQNFDTTSDGGTDSGESYSKPGPSREGSCSRDTSLNDTASEWDNLSLNVSNPTFSGNGSATNESETEEEDKMETRKLHGLIMERATICKGKKTQDPLPFTKKNMVSILALGVLLTPDCDIDLSELTFWLRSGAVSFEDHLKLVPNCMATFGRELVTPHFKNWSVLGENVRKVGRILELGDVNLSSSDQIKVTFQRLVKEFSLPHGLYDLLTSALEPHSEVLEVKFILGWEDSQDESSAFREAKVAALILFGLKYLYGLDGLTERCYSNCAKAWNQEHPRGAKMFDIGEWIALSRMRAQLACKYSYLLHRYYHDLFPEVEMSPGTLLQMGEIEDLVGRRWVGQFECQKSLEEVLPDIINDPFLDQARGAPYPENQVDILSSRTPLHDFSQHFTGNLPVEHEAFPAFGKSVLQKLDQMRESEIKMVQADENIPDVDLEIYWREIKHVYLRRQQPDYIKRCYLPKQRLRSMASPANPTRRHYWFVDFRRTVASAKEANRFEIDQMRTLPDGFQWILNYFAASICIAPVDLLRELRHVEKRIGSVDPKFFGVEIKPRCLKSRRKKKRR